MTTLRDERTQAALGDTDWRWFMLVVRRALLLVVREIEKKYGKEE